jgi:hypothetical protein
MQLRNSYIISEPAVFSSDVSSGVPETRCCRHSLQLQQVGLYVEIQINRIRYKQKISYRTIVNESRRKETRQVNIVTALAGEHRISADTH